MTKLEFAGVIAWLTVAIGKPIADNEAEQTARMNVFYECLGDLPIATLQLAAKKVALEHKWHTFPSVSELRTAASGFLMGKDAKMTGGEAWALAWKAASGIDPSLTGPYMARSAVTGEMTLFENQMARAMEGLPAIVVDAMKAFGIVALTEADPNFARPQFIKIFDAIVERKRHLALMPDSMKRAIESQQKPSVLPSPVAAAIKQIGAG